MQPQSSWKTSGAAGREVLECDHRQVDIVDRDEQVVVVVAGDDVGADPVLGERGRECGGEPDGIKRRVHLQRDPPSHEVVRKSASIGLGLGDDDGTPSVSRTTISAGSMAAVAVSTITNT